MRPRAVVETRPGCRIAIAHARPPWLDGVLTIGVRTTQVAGWRADVVIAGAPGADFVGPPRLGPEANAVIGERRGTVLQLEAPHAGRFRTRHEIAGRVEVGDVLGELGAFAVVASGSGMLTALAARGARVAPGHVLAEIDATADLRACFGIAPNARAIARRVAAAIRGATPADRPEPAAASTGFA